MSVYRDARSPYWQYDFQIDRRRFCGSTKVKRTDPQRDAEAVEARARETAQALIDAERANNTGPMKLGVACDRWWNEVGRHGNDPDIEARLKWIVGYLGANKLLNAITDNDVSLMVAERRLDVRKAGRDDDGKQLYRPITARTVNKTTSGLLRRVIARARDNWNVNISKEPKWKKHVLAHEKPPIVELSRAQELALDVAESVDYALLREFATITGLRRRAALVTWPQCDFDRDEIRYRAKGGKWKIVPMPQSAKQILLSRRGHHPIWVFTYKALKSRTIPKGKHKRVKGQRYPITYYGWGSHHDSVWKKAGVEARIHDLRHTAGSRTLRKNRNLKVVQLMLGHTDIKTTAEFYANVLLEDIRAAMDETAPARRAPWAVDGQDN